MLVFSLTKLFKGPRGIDLNLKQIVHIYLVLQVNVNQALAGICLHLLLLEFCKHARAVALGCSSLALCSFKSFIVIIRSFNIWVATFVFNRHHRHRHREWIEPHLPLSLSPILSLKTLICRFDSP